MWFTEPECFQADQYGALVTHATGGDLHIVLAPQAVRGLRPGTRGGQPGHRRAIRPLRRPAGRPRGTGFQGHRGTAQPAARSPLRLDQRQAQRHETECAGGGIVVFGLIAVRDGADVWVRTFRPDRLSAVLADVLPDWTPGEPACRRADPAADLAGAVQDSAEPAGDPAAGCALQPTERVEQSSPELADRVLPVVTHSFGKPAGSLWCSPTSGTECPPRTVCASRCASANKTSVAWRRLPARPSVASCARCDNKA
jgi:hypothetical protein